MDELGIDRSIVMPTPNPPDLPNSLRAADLAMVAAAHPDRLWFMAGGGSLNVEIQRAVAGEVVDVDDFRDLALSIVDAGAVGFGEFAGEHIVIGGEEPYVSAPPDHPLFLVLADIAATEGVPIDLHMEAVPFDLPIPVPLAGAPNPSRSRLNSELTDCTLSDLP